jgi:hypothetical protein
MVPSSHIEHQMFDATHPHYFDSIANIIINILFIALILNLDR